MCPVCFTGGDPVTRETLNAGIGVLLGVTVLVLALFARFFVMLARRSKAAAHLVDHAAEGRPYLANEAGTGLEGLGAEDVSAVAAAKAERKIA